MAYGLIAVLIIPASVAAYLLIGLMLGIYISFQKYKWRFLKCGGEIIEDFTNQWLKISIDGIKIYLSERAKKRRNKKQENNFCIPHLERGDL